MYIYRYRVHISAMHTVAGALTRAACLAGGAATPRKNRNVVMAVVLIEPKAPPGMDVSRTVKSKKLPRPCKLQQKKNIPGRLQDLRLPIQLVGILAYRYPFGPRSVPFPAPNTSISAYDAVSQSLVIPCAVHHSSFATVCFFPAVQHKDMLRFRAWGADTVGLVIPCAVFRYTSSRLSVIFPSKIRYYYCLSHPPSHP